jgi:hypothetical protein
MINISAPSRFFRSLSRGDQDETRPGRDETEAGSRIIAQASATAKTGPSKSLRTADCFEKWWLGGLVALRDAQWARRPMSETSFIGGPGISRGQFVKVLDALEGAGLIERERTHFHREGPVPSGKETRLRLTEVGKALARDHGVAQAHFSEPY